MKFKREVLIERAKARRERHIEAVAERNAKAEKEMEESLTKHLQDRELSALINFLRRHRDNGTPITKKAIDEAGIRGFDTEGWSSRARLDKNFVFSSTGLSPEKPDTRRIDAFIQFLEAATDDEVSSAALVQHGFKDFPKLI